MDLVVMIATSDFEHAMQSNLIVNIIHRYTMLKALKPDTLPLMTYTSCKTLTKESYAGLTKQMLSSVDKDYVEFIKNKYPYKQDKVYMDLFDIVQKKQDFRSVLESKHVTFPKFESTDGFNDSSYVEQIDSYMHSLLDIVRSYVLEQPDIHRLKICLNNNIAQIMFRMMHDIASYDKSDNKRSLFDVYAYFNYNRWDFIPAMKNFRLVTSVDNTLFTRLYNKCVVSGITYSTDCMPHMTALLDYIQHIDNGYVDILTERQNSVQTLLKNGFVVFPCLNNSPDYQRCLDMDLTESNEIYSLTSTKLPYRAPYNSNFGIQCGRRSGVVVIEVCLYNNGLAYWKDLLAVNGLADIDTLRVKTIGSSRYYFKWQPFMDNWHTMNRVFASGEVMGVDFRTDYGYTVAPPTIGYTFDNVKDSLRDSVMPMPSWLVTKFETWFKNISRGPHQYDDIKFESVYKTDEVCKWYSQKELDEIVNAPRKPHTAVQQKSAKVSRNKVAVHAPLPTILSCQPPVSVPAVSTPTPAHVVIPIPAPVVSAPQPVPVVVPVHDQQTKPVAKKAKKVSYSQPSESESETILIKQLQKRYRKCI